MKKTLFAALLCCLVILLMIEPCITWITNISRDRQVNTDLAGYCLSPSEGDGTCTVRIQGRFRDYLFDFKMDQFNAGIEGEIWVDDRKLEIWDIPFHNKAENPLLHRQEGTYFMDRECSTFVALLDDNGSEALVVAPAADRAQALSLLEKLAGEPENVWHADFFSQCARRLGEDEG